MPTKKQLEKSRSNGTNIVFALGLGILSFIFLNVLITSLVFLLHGTVSVWWLILSLLGSVAITYWKLKKDKITKPFIWIGALLVAFTGTVAFASQTFDTTWDGNDYHKTAIAEMKDGWNPVWEPLLDFHNSSRNPLNVIEGGGEFRNTYLTNWTDHYPKATWIFAANIYSATGSIESGKAITTLSMIMLFCFAFSFFYRLFGRNKALIISLLLTFSPVVITQVFNYYNDGVLGNFLMVLIILFTMLVMRRPEDTKQRALILAGIAMVIVPMVNFKFSALPYAAIVAATYFGFLLFRRDWKLVRDVTITGIIALVLGLLVVGASSYVVNTIRNHNPIYPLAGEGKIDIMQAQQPVGYAEELGIRKFIENNLYKTANFSYELNPAESPQLKIPFTISMDELSILRGTSDARQGGYGVWFGGILIISLITSIYLSIRYGRQYKEYLPAFLLPLITIAITILVFDNTWWARYLPQLIIFPVLVIVALFALRVRILPYVLAFALFFNVTLTGLLAVNHQVDFIKSTRANLAGLECSKQKPTTIGYGMFYGAIYNIKDRCSNIVVSHSHARDLPKDRVVPLYQEIFKIKN